MSTSCGAPTPPSFSGVHNSVQVRAHHACRSLLQKGLHVRRLRVVTRDGTSRHDVFLGEGGRPYRWVASYATICTLCGGNLRGVVGGVANATFIITCQHASTSEASKPAEKKPTTTTTQRDDKPKKCRHHSHDVVGRRYANVVVIRRARRRTTAKAKKYGARPAEHDAAGAHAHARRRPALRGGGKLHHGNGTNARVHARAARGCASHRHGVPQTCKDTQLHVQRGGTRLSRREPTRNGEVHRRGWPAHTNGKADTAIPAPALVRRRAVVSAGVVR
mmetsp:Transcript_9977/g.26715  ORF Transcript_9977/g.26715 Transcript_9977/m.26715 type:complete len:276 (+) Transcript_9977:30-857(+)